MNAETRHHRDCPACGAPSAGAERVAYEHPDWPMRRCAQCRLIYLEWVPDYGALYDEISWTRQHKKEEERRLKAMPILARIDMATRWRLGLFGDATPAGGLNAWAKPGPVLDVGCSTGKGFAKLKGGRIPHGIEIDARAAEIATAAFAPLGGAVTNSDGVGGLKQWPAKYFTGVTLWSYLEHEANPRAALEETRRVLTDDGIALVKVPNFNCVNRMVLGRNWPGFRHPDHVQYFTPATLAAMARAAGFAVKFRLYGRIPTNDNMYAILRPA
jgi:SAM-dependent methyltransferase